MTTNISEYLENALSLADAATEGPWMDLDLGTGGRNIPLYHVTLSYDYEHDIAKAQDPDNAEFIAASRTLVPEMVGALQAMENLAEWHETKAYKASCFGSNSWAVQYHLDAASRIRDILDRHLGGRDD